MFKRLLRGMTQQREDQRRAELYRNLIRHEAKIGGEIFGPVAPGVRREFFCLDEHTWVWHEEWKDKSGQVHIQMTRYDVRPSGIMKVQHGRYMPVSKQEAATLYKAVKRYRERIQHEMYAAVA